MLVSDCPVTLVTTKKLFVFIGEELVVGSLVILGFVLTNPRAP
jgi:hypothetical protein